MLARYYGSNQARFLSVDPLASSTKLTDPQSWNRYAYVQNRPMNFVDPKGLCSAPTMPDGSVGVCAEAFIATERVPDRSVAYGDGRTFAADDASLTSRVQVQVVVNPSTGSVGDPIVKPGESEAGERGVVTISGLGYATADVSNVHTNDQGTTTFTLTVSGTNGLDPTVPSIDFSLNLQVGADGAIGLFGGGATDGYPSVGVYGYRNGEAPTKLFEHAEGSLRDLAEPMEVTIPRTPPR